MYTYVVCIPQVNARARVQFAFRLRFLRAFYSNCGLFFLSFYNAFYIRFWSDFLFAPIPLTRRELWRVLPTTSTSKTLCAGCGSGLTQYSRNPIASTVR